MLNDRRRLWTSILFICFFAPFAAVFVVNMATLTMRRTGAPIAVRPPASSTFAGPAEGVPTLAPGRAPLLAAGDGRDVWVALPLVNENSTRGFQLFNRASNGAGWRVATRNGTQTFLSAQGFPHGLMLLEPAAGGAGTGGGSSVAYVVGDSGWVMSYWLEGDARANPLPPNHVVKAATGGANQLFVVTQGPEVGKAGDVLPADLLMGGSGGTAVPETMAATSTMAGAATSPATTRAAAPVGVEGSAFHVWWYPPTSALSAAGVEEGRVAGTQADRWPVTAGSWISLPGLAAVAGDAGSVPTASSLMALAVQNERLILMWVDTAHARTLMVRHLDYGSRNGVWSEVIKTELPEDVPAASRLLTVMLDRTLYVLWTVPTANAAGSTVALHGGWMNTDPRSGSGDVYKLAEKHFLLPMSLESAGMGISPVTDVAAGVSENSIVAVAVTKEGGLASRVFNNRGQPLSDAAAVEPRMPRRDVLIGQNIAMILLVLMLTLSLWQWRQKPVPLALPTGLIVAPLHLRAGAFLIDAVVPYLAVLLIFKGWENGGVFTLLSTWFSGLGQPEELVKSKELYVFLGMYLLHVTVGELIFKRSLGKAVLRLRILMVDGKGATPGAILIRNLVRLPEMAVGIVVLYLVVSDRHQRLGDLLGQTVVVAKQKEEDEKEKGSGRKK